MLSHARLRALCVAFASLLALGTAPQAWAADPYPSRPIRFVVSFPPGGGNDFLARLVAAKMTELRGWNVVIENVPGAGGVPGTSAIAKAAPNGYTIGMGSIGTLSINPSLYRNIPFDVRKDLAAVSRLSITPAALVVPANLPLTSVRQLLEAARTQPGGLNFASAGNGTSHHLAAELFAHRAGIKLTHVPYAGSGPAITGLLRGDTQMMFADLPAILPMVRAGKLRALAVTTLERSSLMPDVPTISETLPGFDVSIWYAIVAPAGTPKDIVAVLNKAVRDVVALPEVRQRLAEEGALAQASSPEELSAFMEGEIARWAEVIRTAKVSIQ
ncbi:MAG: LacI family transcriptional regulator [Ramlibacter sp.]|nr:LacI family transcriptional regulator [Ramlibacter sp.]